MRLCMLLALALFSPLALANEMEEASRVDFEIRDPKTKEVYFTGREDISIEGKNVTRDARYFDPEKKEVQVELVTYDKDSLKVSRYEFQNKVTGEEAKLLGDAEEVKIEYRESGKTAAQKESVKLEKNSFHGKVVNKLILRNWKALMSNNIYKFSLLLPSRLDKLNFQIIHRRSYTLDAEKREVFALIPQNILIRSLTPHLEFEYAAGEKPVLKQFLGPSPLPIKRQKDKMVIFVFTYPEAEAKKP